MAYYSVKNIKGCFYLYEQRSYRENGLVKTVSKYIRPITAAQAIGFGTRSEFIDLNILNEKQKPKKEAVKPIKKRAHKKSNLTKQKQETTHIKVSLDIKKYQISERVLNKAIFETKEIFKLAGVSFDDSTSIKIKHGKTLDAKKSLNGFVVTVPNETGYSRKIKKEVIKATFKQGMEMLKKQNPDRYKPLLKGLRENHKKINQGITEYINLTDRNERRAEAKGIAVKVWGNTSFLKGLSKNQIYKIKPENLGLIDFDTRNKNFLDSAASIFTENLLTNSQDFYEKHETARKNAENLYHRYQKQYSQISRLKVIKKLRAKKSMLRAKARLKSTTAMLDNIKLVQSIFEG